MEKICNDKQILNPITNRCVNKNGIIGKKLLIDNEKIHLFWENNSCYIDSILIALFHNKNTDILNYPLIIYKNDKLNLLTKKINVFACNCVFFFCISVCVNSLLSLKYT